MVSILSAGFFCIVIIVVFYNILYRYSIFLNNRLLQFYNKIIMVSDLIACGEQIFNTYVPRSVGAAIILWKHTSRFTRPYRNAYIQTGTYMKFVWSTYKLSFFFTFVVLFTVRVTLFTERGNYTTCCENIFASRSTHVCYVHVWWNRRRRDGDDTHFFECEQDLTVYALRR